MTAPPQRGAGVVTAQLPGLGNQSRGAHSGTRTVIALGSTRNLSRVTFERLPPGIEAELAARHPIRLSVTHNTVEVTLKEDEGGILAVVSALAGRGRVLRLEVGGASLEDIFVELTKEGPRPAVGRVTEPGGTA